MAPTRRVAFCGLVTDLLQQLLELDTGTQLVVCGTKIEFLVQLSAAISSQRTDASTTLRHDLLTKTIGLLAQSRRVRVTFCPSLESLRAYLAVLGRTGWESTGAENQVLTAQSLVILNMIALHASTTELSAQGLSRTLAAAVESASRAALKLILCECANAVDPSSTQWGGGLWDMQVPLLNGSVRLRSEEGRWGGHGVPVKVIAQRWFDFDEEKRS